MSKSFTYIISSRDGINSNAAANSFSIMLNGLPSHVNKFACEVKSFAIPIGTLTFTPSTLHILMLTVNNNFINSNEVVSGNRTPNIVAMCDLVTGFNDNVGIKFIVDNFNGKLITFNLVDERFTAIDVASLNQNGVNTAWTLVLELTPLED